METHIAAGITRLGRRESCLPGQLHVIRLILADNPTLIAQALHVLIASNIEIEATVADGNALLDSASSLAPDVIVVDIAMYLRNGPEPGRRKRYPSALLLYRRRGRLSHLPRPLAFAHHGTVSSQLRYLANREASIRIVIAISDSPQKSAPSSPMSGTLLAVVGSFLGAASDFFGAASAVSTGGVG